MPLPEKKLIAEIRRMAGERGRIRPANAGRGTRSTRVGIGDDCAVLHLPAGDETLVTTDFSLEGVHFRRDWHPPEVIGHRCLARGLSDIAAMGGEPVAAFLSLALPPDVPQPWVRGFTRGLMALAKRYGVTLAGGDSAQSPQGVLADIVVIGAVPAGQAILRSGARPGDRIFVSGALGGSAAAVLALQANPNRKLRPQDYPRHFQPEPRLELGRILRKQGVASAMIDTSDGLSTDLAHLCDESTVGAELDLDRVPRARVGKPAREVDLDLALHGGEDYELLFTVRPGKTIPEQIAGVPLTEIGKVTKSKGMLLRNSKGMTRRLQPHGWEHFKK